ncbi:hypothetical protein [Microbulbifer sp. PSTR4-B]|uniref:hypothetical protein n=1 Tax=Microbulbifer sp. PSTR4-B TaxID=3243396 RepID=UPI00403A30A0
MLALLLFLGIYLFLKVYLMGQDRKNGYVRFETCEVEEQCIFEYKANTALLNSIMEEHKKSKSEAIQEMLIKELVDTNKCSDVKLIKVLGSTSGYLLVRGECIK